MVIKPSVRSNLLVIGLLVGCGALAGQLTGCGSVSTQIAEERATATVVVECLIEGTEDFIEVLAQVVVGGVRGQTNLQDNWVILQNVPLGTESPPQQPLTVTARGYVTASQMLTLSEYSYTAASISLAPADLDVTGTVSGTVTDVDTAEPVSNALVSFLPAGAQPGEAVDGFTDQGGWYIIGGIPAGPVAVTCQAADYFEDTADYVVTADSAGDNDPLDFRLFSGEAVVTVSGHVLEMRTESPVAGAEVQIGEQPPVVSDTSGTFSVPDVPMGEQAVTASAEGYDDYYTVINVVPGLNDLTILLNEFSPQPPGAPYTITGRVTLLGAADDSGAVVTAFDLNRGLVLAEDTTGADGYYYLFVPPGAYRIEVAYGDRTIGREVELLGGGRVLESINFTLTVD